MQNNKYADVVIDITNENVDRPFTYAVPESLRDSARPGMPVLVPFGNGGRTKTGYIIALKEETELDPARVKEILGPAGGAVTAETTLIELAVWMHSHYGCMLNQALRGNLPRKCGGSTGRPWRASRRRWRKAEAVFLMRRRAEGFPWGSPRSALWRSRV